MNTDRDLLDEAIDHVSSRLTHVDDDPQFASGIVAALPERVTWFGWLTYSWAPRLAMVAIVAVAAVFWNGRRTTEVSPVVSQPVASVTTPVSQQPTVVASNPQPLVPVRTKPMEPMEPLEPLEPLEPSVPRSDHEFSLAAVEAPKVLAMGSVGPEALESSEALSVPSLTIADLPLTSGGFAQRD